MQALNFSLNTKIIYGVGSIKQLFEIITEEKWSSVGVCIDKTISEIEIFSQILEKLESQTDFCNIHKVDITEPTYEYLDTARKGFENSKIDVVIGIGGGSALDVAKGIAVLINNKKPAISYRGFDQMEKPVPPIIGIPTTAGTGSEITPNASFIDNVEKRKLGINGEVVRPTYAILDPELTLSCPLKPTISAGVDAIVHAHDSFISKGNTTISRVFSLEGFRRVYNHLPMVAIEPENIKYRQEVLYGAFFAAVGMIHSGGGATAVLSYPLGVHYGVPHGIAGGIFLPHVVKFNVEHGFDNYTHFYKNIDYKVLNNARDKNLLFVDHLSKLWEELNIPNNISQYGYTVEQKQKFIDDSLMMQGGLDGNPIEFGSNEIESILDQLTV
jgi:alcohol dehydrogenase class IV